jgi:hypothetical protein
VGKGGARNRGHIIQARADPTTQESARFGSFDQGLACTRARPPGDEIANFRIGGTFRPSGSDKVEHSIEDFFAHGHGAYKALQVGKLPGF